MMMLVPDQGQRSVFSSDFISTISVSGKNWSVNDFIHVHNMVRKSQKYNFEGCKIPSPTTIRYDRIRQALGDRTTPKEDRVLNLH